MLRGGCAYAPTRMSLHFSTKNAIGTTTSCADPYVIMYIFRKILFASLLHVNFITNAYIFKFRKHEIKHAI